MKTEAAEYPRLAGRARRFLRNALPFAISALLLVYLFSRIDVGLALEYVTGEVAIRFALPLLLFNGVTLFIEAHCLHRVAAAGNIVLPMGTAARIKAACYLLNVLNYALGAAGLAVLLRRRAQAGIADAASMVFLISLFDIGSVLALAATGAGFLQTETTGLRLGLILILIAAIVAGFVFLRAPTSMGPLDAVRELDVFRAPRTAPIALLIELGILRSAFVLSYVALAVALFQAFEIEVPLLRLALNVAFLLVVSALPIAAGGLGTGQIAFVALFSGLAPDAKLLAASIVLSIGLVVTRALLGLLFAPEFTREVLVVARKEAAAQTQDLEDGRDG